MCVCVAAFGQKPLGEGERGVVGLVAFPAGQVKSSLVSRLNVFARKETNIGTYSMYIM